MRVAIEDENEEEKMSSLKRSAVAAVCLQLALTAATPSVAQEYPSKPLRFIAPNLPGGPAVQVGSPGQAALNWRYSADIDKGGQHRVLYITPGSVR